MLMAFLNDILIRSPTEMQNTDLLLQPVKHKCILGQGQGLNLLACFWIYKDLSLAIKGPHNRSAVLKGMILDFTPRALLETAEP